MSREEGLEKRLGFDPEGAYSFRVAGVTFENRQGLLAKMRDLCSYEVTPPVKLAEAMPEDKLRFNDPNAIEVWAATSRNDLTGEWGDWCHIGYVPRGACSACHANMTQSLLDVGECPRCASRSVYSPNEALTAAGVESLRAGVDNVIQNQYGRETLGCVVYVRTKNDEEE
jgi:hypothetical protein